MPHARSSSKANSTANLGFEAKPFWSSRNPYFERPALALQPLRRLFTFNFLSKDDDVRWQWREATWTTNGSPKGAHNQAHQYPSPQRGNANFAWVQHFIHHLAPQAMAGFVLVRFGFWMKLKATRVFRRLRNGTSVRFGERQSETVFIDARIMSRLIAHAVRAFSVERVVNPIQFQARVKVAIRSTFPAFAIRPRYGDYLARITSASANAEFSLDRCFLSS